MKTRQQTLNNYFEATNVTFENNGHILDLLTKRDLDIYEYLVDMFNDFSHLAQNAELPVDKYNFQQKKQLIGTILEQFHL